MPSKMVVDVGKLCGSLAGSAIQHRDQITVAMTEMWSDRLAEGQIPDIQTIQTCIAQDLRDIHQQLIRDSRQLNSDLTEARKGRIARDGSLVETREALFAVRKVLDAIYGPGGADALFEESGSRVAVDPATVYEQAVVVSRNLTDPDFVRPEVRLDVGVDVAALAQRVLVPSRKLGEALDELNLANPRTHASLEAKDRSYGKMTRKALQGAQLLEAIYTYAGHEGIASRTRRSSHRSRRAGQAGSAGDQLAGADATAGNAAAGPSPRALPDPAAPDGGSLATSGAVPVSQPGSPAGVDPDIPPEIDSAETVESETFGASFLALPEQETVA